ncbi:MAG: ParB/RepB/Spo0J family partition protein [Planctomycetota bacterium]|jgi:ParB family chromosome partitioning protein|nr:ParB/RepB/Spo0J family partition protein [Planctomycetota bacterium]
MPRPRGLGRGLDSLIAPAGGPEGNFGPADGAERIWELEVGNIVPSPCQPRRNFDPGKLDELARSIREDGLMQPLVVRRLPDGTHELIAGERRLRAMRDILKLSAVPVRLMTADDLRAHALTLQENLQRDDLNPIEKAAGYQRLQQELGLTHEDLAKRLHVSRSVVSNVLRLVGLPEEVKRLVAEQRLDEGKARAIAGMESPLEQIRLARLAADGNLTTREVEKRAKGKNPAGPAGERKPEKGRNLDAEALEERLRRHFGSKVAVADRNGKGRIIIDYFSVGEAQRILDRMGLPPE